MGPGEHTTSGLIVYVSITDLLASQRRMWLHVAREAGISEDWLYKVRHLRSPKVECVQAVASVLGVPPWTLLWPESAQPGSEPEPAGAVSSG